MSSLASTHMSWALGATDFRKRYRGHAATATSHQRCPGPEIPPMLLQETGTPGQRPRAPNIPEYRLRARLGSGRRGHVCIVPDSKLAPFGTCPSALANVSGADA